MEFRAKRGGHTSCKARLRHFILLPICAAVLSLVIAAPYLSGKFDPSALGLSQAIQAMGALGLLPAIVGIVWIVYEIERARNDLRASIRHRFAIAVAVSSAPAICALILIALAASGTAIAIMICVLIIFIGLKFTPYFRKVQAKDKGFCVVPVYFFMIPIALILFQALFAVHFTDSCRNRAVNNAEALIAEIEEYHNKNGFYPDSLFAVNHDYEPSIIGIDGYHYAKAESSYNLYFAQPRFLFDDFGAREYIVYNPSDAHAVYSHDGWILHFAPSQAKANQGWYSSGALDKPHWKYFLFD
jgi:hypothetical protein